MEMELLPYMMACDNRESAEAIANVANAIQAKPSYVIDIEGEIGAKGWEAIRRVGEHLMDVTAAQDPPEIWMDRIDRKAIVAGAKEDHLGSS